MIENKSGSEDNPIQILEDDEQKRKLEEQIQFNRNRQSLYTAHMGSQFDVLLAIVKLDIKGTPQQKDRVIKNRLSRFFSSSVKKIDLDNGHFRQIRQPNYKNPQVQPVPTQIIIFGVDFLSTKQIKNKFIGLEIKIIWLDDSNCKVKFNTQQDAKKGIQMNLKQKSQYTVKIQNQQMQVPRGWFEFLPYFYLTYQRKLRARYAASNEDQAQIDRSNQFYLYQEARRLFEQSIKQQVSEQRYFETMRKYYLIDQRKYRQRLRRNNGGNRGNRGNRQEFQSIRQKGNQNRHGRNWDNGRDRYNGNNNGRRGNRYDNQDYNNQNQNKYRDQRSQRYNNNNRNINKNTSIQIGQNQQVQRSRDKRGQAHDNFDGLSMVSRNSLQSSHKSISPIAKPRQRKQSISVCSNAVNNQDNEENYSFILDQRDLDSSQQLMMGLKNMNIGDISDIDYKQQQFNGNKPIDNISICSMKKNKSFHQENKSNKIFNTSIVINEDHNSSKRHKKKDINTSIVIYEKPEKEIKKQSASINQIQIYDDDDGY